MELVLPPDYAMIIALKWIFKVKLVEHDVALINRQGLLLRDIGLRKALISEESFALVVRIEAI